MYAWVRLICGQSNWRAELPLSSGRPGDDEATRGPRPPGRAGPVWRRRFAPSNYGEEAGDLLWYVDERRDRIELLMARWALAEGLPILAICRGIQVLNVAAGGRCTRTWARRFRVHLLTRPSGDRPEAPSITRSR